MTPTKSPIQTLPIKHSQFLYTHSLGIDMYKPLDALWEGIKNGWDAGIRKLRRPGQGKFDIFVDLMFYKNHPLSPSGPALVILDNGEGMTSLSLTRFTTVGPEDDKFTTYGVMDRKRIGRISMYAMLKEPLKGFWALSSTSSTGQVRVVQMDPAKMARGAIDTYFVDRDDTILHGLRPEGTFTAIVLPNIVPDIQNEQALVEHLRWQIPRRVANNGFTLRLNGNEVKPAPLTGKKVEAGGLIGWFKKDDRKKPQGIRLCDAETNTVCAEAVDMSRHLPYPMGRPELTGDIFIPGLAANQRTDRSGLSSVFLKSDEWMSIKEILFTHFRPVLVEILGEDETGGGVNRTIRSIVLDFNQVWGEPPADVVPPPGITPSDLDENLFIDGDPEPPNEGLDEPRQGRKPHRRRKPQKKPTSFVYRGQVYFLSDCAMEPGKTAEVMGDNVVYLNNHNPLFDRFRSASMALRLHVVESVIGAIERADLEKHNYDINDCFSAVHEAVVYHFGKLDELKK